MIGYHMIDSSCLEDIYDGCIEIRQSSMLAHEIYPQSGVRHPHFLAVSTVLIIHVTMCDFLWLIVRERPLFLKSHLLLEDCRLQT